tara:strand:- start:827 stop:1312 length:486 start_codon:yes stop_codon:yes gene_type:complete
VDKSMKKLCKKIVTKLIKKKIKITFAESCTGGLLSSAITSVKGSSKVFNLGLITYSNPSKINLLRISKEKIKKYGSVSKQVCFEMARNASKIGKTSMSVSITGVAGPDGGTENKPVGLVYIGVKKGNKIYIKKCLFKNKGRYYIQKNSVIKSLKLILASLK